MKSVLQETSLGKFPKIYDPETKSANNFSIAYCLSMLDCSAYDNTLGLVTLTSACDHILQGDLPINNTNTANEVTSNVKQN
jgi:hypothetical protein